MRSLLISACLLPVTSADTGNTTAADDAQVNSTFVSTLKAAEATEAAAVGMGSWDSESYHKLASDLFERLNKGEAVEKEIEKAYLNALQLDPLSDRTYFHLGELYSRSGNRMTPQGVQAYSAASRMFRWAAQINPKDPDAYINVGSINLEMGDFQQALRSFRKGVDLRPTSSEAYYNIGMAYNHQRKYKQALKAYSTATELNPLDWEAYEHMAKLYLQHLGDPAKSEQLFHTFKRIQRQQAASANQVKGD